MSKERCDTTHGEFINKITIKYPSGIVCIVINIVCGFNIMDSRNYMIFHLFCRSELQGHDEVDVEKGRL